MDAIQNKSLQRTPEEISSFIEQWCASGKDKTTFCRENGINYQTFIGWTLRREKKKAEHNFIPLSINSSDEKVFAEISFRGAKIIFHSAVSAQYLRTVLR